ncbi:MAG TPA: HAD family hydrolase [Rhizobiaceae bacterium]|nr:HAD family hydrolase [Rhizobiaceae bacterium]
MRSTRPGSAIRAVLFDKDGTLIDFHRTWGPINRQAALFASRGDGALAEAILADCGMDSTTGITRADSLFAAANPREIAARMVELGARFTVDGLVEGLDDLFARAARHAVPIGDPGAVMRALAARGNVFGVASSDNERSIRITLDALGLANQVPFVAGYDSGHGVKPGPGMALAFARFLGVSPASIAMVGDNRHDLEMGRAAGAGLVVGVLSGTGTRETLTPLADHVISSIADLPTIL